MVSRHKNNDKDFMLRLYHDYYGLVRRNIHRITHDENSVDDLVNDTFARLIERIPLLQDFDCNKTAAYIVYTAKSIAINFIIRRDTQNKHLFYTDEIELITDQYLVVDDVADKVLLQQDIALLVETTLQLPQKLKDILYFKYVFEMEDTEIGEALGISSSSVRMYLTRARRALIKLLDKGGDMHDS